MIVWLSDRCLLFKIVKGGVDFQVNKKYKCRFLVLVLYFCVETNFTIFRLDFCLHTLNIKYYLWPSLTGQKSQNHSKKLQQSTTTYRPTTMFKLCATIYDKNRILFQAKYRQWKYFGKTNILGKQNYLILTGKKETQNQK